MARTILIGDIHGCLDTFQALLTQIKLDRQDTLILLGDYIDRGPNSKEVLDEVMRLMDAQLNVIALRGNHEQMLLSDHRAETERGWHDMADEELKASFAIKNLKQLPIKYIEFCKSLPYYHEEADFIAVHAGLNFAYKDPLQEKEDLIWIRDWYKDIDYKWLKDKTIIHGHTPLTIGEIEEQFNHYDKMQVLNIDCGVFMSEKKEHGLGFLCAFDLTNRQLFFQENIDKGCKY